MPYRSMDLKDLAKFLGMDIRQLDRMAQRGEIPCQKVGGQLRFNRAEITEWLQQRMGEMSHDHLADVEAGIGAHRDADPKFALVSSLVQENGINLALPARTKRSVLKELVQLAEQTGLVWNSEELLEAVEQREELCSTALEGGIAIPHPRRPLEYAIAEPLLVLGRTTTGIGFNAPDGKLTDLFFLTCSQDDRFHLHVLARLCRMLHDFDFVEDVRHAETPEQIIELIWEREQKVITLQG